MAYLDSQWQQFKWQYYMIIILYFLSFAIMFPYFEMFKNAVSEGDNVTFSEMMTKHWLFFFVMLPMQLAIAIYLTWFEWKKMWATKDKWQLTIVIYNFWQVIMPFFDMIEYVI